MQAIAASSNAQVAASSPSRVHQWKKSMVLCHMSSTNIAMPCQPNIYGCGKTADKRLNVPSAYMAYTPKPAYLDVNGGTINEDPRMNPCSEVEMHVRDNELDQFGMVDNAIYLCYCRHGHQELLKKVGLGADLVAEADATTTLSDLSFKFFAALRSGDRFIVRTNVSCISTSGIFVENFIVRLPDRELILEAKATIVLIDRNCRPVHISPGIKANLLMLSFFDNCD